MQKVMNLDTNLAPAVLSDYATGGGNGGGGGGGGGAASVTGIDAYIDSSG